MQDRYLIINIYDWWESSISTMASNWTTKLSYFTLHNSNIYNDLSYSNQLSYKMCGLKSKFDAVILKEREIKFIGLFEDRGHRGPYIPYKLFNHNLYIGIIIFPHIDNPQSTGYN